MPADGLSPIGERPSANKVLTEKARVCFSMFFWRHLKWSTRYRNVFRHAGCYEELADRIRVIHCCVRNFNYHLFRTSLANLALGHKTSNFNIKWHWKVFNWNVTQLTTKRLCYDTIMIEYKAKFLSIACLVFTCLASDTLHILSPNLGAHNSDLYVSSEF